VPAKLKYAHVCRAGTGGRGLVRINLTEVGNLLGHHGNGIAGYGAAGKLIDRRLEDMFGRGRPEAPRNPGFSLRRMSRPVVRMQEALTSPSRVMSIRSREPRDQCASRGIRATWIRARYWNPILQWERTLDDGAITPFTDARN